MVENDDLAVMNLHPNVLMMGIGACRRPAEGVSLLNGCSLMVIGACRRPAEGVSLQTG